MSHDPSATPDHPKRQHQPVGRGNQSARVASTELLQGHRELEIEHAGDLYRLRVTRLGKLILTK